MAELYQLIPSGFSFEKVDGYNKVLPATIGKYFEHARGDGTNLFVVKHYAKEKTTVLSKGYIPDGADELTLSVAQIELNAFLDKEKERAVARIGDIQTKVYQHREGSNSVVFVSCQDGLIGCGWYDPASSPKGLKMAAFVLYAYGFINAKMDKVFWKVTYKYLPYDSELGRSDEADKAIIESLQPEILRRNNERSKVVRLNNDSNGTT